MKNKIQNLLLMLLVKMQVKMRCRDYKILDVVLKRNPDGKLEATVTYEKRTRANATSRLECYAVWNAYLEVDGKAVEEYSYCGDVNYRHLKGGLDEFLSSGDAPENVLYGVLKDHGIVPDVVVKEEIVYYNPGYDDMSVSNIIESSKMMTMENPMSSPNFLEYNHRFCQCVAAGISGRIGKGAARELRGIRNEIRQCTSAEIHDVQDIFSVVCYVRGISPIISSCFYNKTK